MGKDASVTPNATVTLTGLDKGFDKNNLKPAAKVTYKIKRGKVAASLAVTDQTIRPLSNAKALKDVVATVDVKAPKVKGVTINTKYEFGTKKYQAGLTWDGTLAKKSSTLKAWYSNKDNKVSGEATVNVAKAQKANVTFNQSNLLTAKYTLVKGDFTYEPSYNFISKAPAVAVTKKVGKDTVKLSYDLKSEATALEWNKKPIKVTLSAVASRKEGILKPAVAVNFEKVYEF